MAKEKTYSTKVTITLFERDKSIVLTGLTQDHQETEVSCISADVKEDSIIEFGVHWIEATSRAVYEEEESEEINSGLRNLTDLRTFFHCIHTFLNK